MVWTDTGGHQAAPCHYNHAHWSFSDQQHPGVQIQIYNVGLSITPQQQRRWRVERREADCLSFKTYIHTSCSNASILSYPSYSWFQFTEN